MSQNHHETYSFKLRCRTLCYLGDKALAQKFDKLTKGDIEALQSNPSDEVRAKIAEKVATEVAAAALSDDEVHIAHAILRMMVKDAADRVRKSLSDCLHNSNHVPHDVAMALAEDIDIIALPMLESSPVFTDADLIAIIQSGAASKQIAIAGRPHVTDQVAGALVATENSKAVGILAANDGAELSQQTFDSIIDRHSSVDGVVDALARREDLPIDIAERLTAHVSNELQNVLVGRYMLPENQAEQLAVASREKATVDLVEEISNAENVVTLANQLNRNGRLTASLILRSLCTGDIRFFEAAMAELASVDMPRAGIMIHDAGPLGLDAIFRKSGLPRVFFPAFRVAVDVYHANDFDGRENDRARFRQRMIERILTQYDGIESEDLDYLINALGKVDAEDQAA